MDIDILQRKVAALEAWQKSMQPMLDAMKPEWDEHLAALSASARSWQRLILPAPLLAEATAQADAAKEAADKAAADQAAADAAAAEKAITDAAEKTAAGGGTDAGVDPSKAAAT